MPEASPQAASQQQGLWAKAPAWRRLNFAAALLTAAAVALPFILKPAGPDAVTPPPGPAMAQGSLTPAGTGGVGGTESAQVCLLVQPPVPTGFRIVTVVSLEDRAIALIHTRQSEARLGGLIDPAYLTNQRVVVRLPNGAYNTYAVPRNMQVHVGDRVAVQRSYRNLNLPCNYVPNLVTADLGPASGLPGPSSSTTVAPAAPAAPEGPARGAGR